MKTLGKVTVLLVFFTLGYLSNDWLETSKPFQSSPTSSVRDGLQKNQISIGGLSEQPQKSSQVALSKNTFDKTLPLNSVSGLSNQLTLPDKKTANLETSLHAGSPDPSDVLTKALKNPDEKIRERALLKSVDLGLVLPEDELIELVRSDPSDSVRALAFRLVTQSSDTDVAKIRETAELALNDASEEIRTQAQGLLDQMDNFKMNSNNQQNSSPQGEISMLNQ